MGAVGWEASKDMDPGTLPGESGGGSKEDTGKAFQPSKPELGSRQGCRSKGCLT